MPAEWMANQFNELDDGCRQAPCAIWNGWLPLRAARRAAGTLTAQCQQFKAAT